MILAFAQNVHTAPKLSMFSPVDGPEAEPSPVFFTTSLRGACWPRIPLAYTGMNAKGPATANNLPCSTSVHMKYLPLTLNVLRLHHPNHPKPRGFAGVHKFRHATVTV